MRFVLAAFLAIFVSTTSAADDLEAGRKAYNAGAYDEALKHWLPLADARHPEAAVYVGSMFDFGLGTAQDRNSAAKYYRVAITGGNHEAKVRLGVLIANMNGDQSAEKEAVRLIMEAYEAAPEDPLTLMGRGFIEEKGVARQPSLANALPFYEKAAERGDESATIFVAAHLIQGKVVKNVHKAFALIVNLWDTTKSEKAFEWLKHMHVEAPVQFKDKIKRHHV